MSAHVLVTAPDRLARNYVHQMVLLEEWARTEGKYIQDGDLPMVPIAQPGVAPVEVATLIPQPTPQPNWQEWWDLFFGEG